MGTQAADAVAGLGVEENLGLVQYQCAIAALKAHSYIVRNHHYRGAVLDALRLLC